MSSPLEPVGFLGASSVRTASARSEREIVDSLMERIPRMKESEKESIRREASIAHMREIGEAMDLVDSAKVWLGGSDAECDPGIRKAAG